METTKEKKCTICKHYGDAKVCEVEKSQIFDQAGSPVSVFLCRTHSVELFKNGQRKFLLNHYRILMDIIGSDDIKFLELLEKTVKANKDKIY